MTQMIPSHSTRPPTSGEVSLAYLIYGLHIFSALTGVLSTALVITAFLTGWPSIIAVILTYLKRDDVRGTYLETHFNWTLHTFWYCTLWVLIGGILAFTIVGFFVGIIIWVGTGLWVLYRLIRGLLNLLSEKPMPIT